MGAMYSGMLGMWVSTFLCVLNHSFFWLRCRVFLPQKDETSDGLQTKANDPDHHNMLFDRQP